jgi:16S rRNA (guanine1516-N2)-methyltransferase
MELAYTQDGKLALTDGATVLTGDFCRLRPRIRPHALNRELLVRAARLKDIDGTPVAIDACAGLGEDGFLLAASGFAVTLFERDPRICALTQDALARASREDDLAPICSRITLVEADARDALGDLADAPHVVYLDPMFPERGKAAATKKKLQVLRALERPASEEEGAELLEAAFGARPRRIIVKRPLKGPCLGSHKPTHTLTGKLIRYDCLIS